MPKNNIGVKFDKGLIFSIAALVAIGIVMVYSSSSIYSREHFGDEYFFIKKHALMVAVGSLFFFLGMRMNCNFLKKMALPMLGISLTLLVFILSSKHGVLKSGAASRWINFHYFSFQPSEFAKISLIIFIAFYLSRVGEEIKSFKNGFLPVAVVSVAFILLIVLQPDFGTAATLGVIVLIMMFVAGVRTMYLSGAVLLAVPPLIYLVLKSGYRLKRIIAFSDPWKDPLGSGFQMIQSFIAFSNGGLWGQGLGDGKQKLLYLPEAHTDFIFSVIGEELGFLGVVIVLGLFSWFIFRGLAAAMRVRDKFATLLAIGITSMIGIQAFINISVTMGLLPTKGLTLPFISYGGSSFVMMMFAAGILVNLSGRVNQTPDFNIPGRF